MTHLKRVERTGILPESSIRKSDIDCRRVQGSVPEQMLEGQQVSGVLIEVSRKGVPKGMACKAVRPAELFFGAPYVTLYILRIIRFIRIVPLREEIIAGTTASSPVQLELFKSDRRQHGVTV